METINAWQFATAMIASYIGLGVFQFPRELMDFSDGEALWSLLLLSLVFFGILKLYMHLALQMGDQPIGPLLSDLFTPVGALPLRLIRFSIGVLLAASALANFGQVMRTFFLPGTPIWAIEAALMLTAGYMAWYGAAVVARTIETVFLPSLVGSIMIGFLVVHELHFLWALVPSTHIKVDALALGAYHSSYIYFSFDTILGLYPVVRPERRQAALTYATRMYLGTVGVFLFGLAIVVGTEGPSAVSLMQWPPVSALRLANARGFFISKLGLLVVVLWGLFILAFIGLRLWYVAYEVSLPSKQHVLVGRYHWVVIAVSVAIFIVAQTFGNVVVLVHVFQTWGIFAVTCYLVIFPLLVLMALGLRRRHQRHSPGLSTDT